MAAQVAPSEVLAQQLCERVHPARFQREFVFPDGVRDAAGQIFAVEGVTAGKEEVCEFGRIGDCRFQHIKGAFDIDFHIVVVGERPARLKGRAQMTDRFHPGHGPIDVVRVGQ